MKSPLAHRKILVLLKQLKHSNEKLNTSQLMAILQHTEDICMDKTTVQLIISSVKSLTNTDISNSKHLTERESEIVILISDGLQNTEIAKSLCLSKSTIETHRKNIRKKLKLKGNDSLFAFALVFSLQSNFYK